VCWVKIYHLSKKNYEKYQDIKHSYQNYETTSQADCQKVRHDMERYRNLLRSLCHDLSASLTMTYSMASQPFTKNTPPCEPDDVSRRFHRLSAFIEMQMKLIKHVKYMDHLIADKQFLKLQPVNLGQALKDMAEVVSHRLEQKRLTFILPLWEAPLMVYAEETSLSQTVLMNVMINAIKFSYPCSKVEVLYRVNPSDPTEVILTIRDDGPGFPHYVASQITQSSKLPSSKGTEGEEGTGFGLVIVHTYMELYGGSMSICSPSQASALHPGTDVELYFKRVGSIT
jgi:K+-sensing histidine kinase KdpD